MYRVYNTTHDINTIDPSHISDYQSNPSDIEKKPINSKNTTKEMTKNCNNSSSSYKKTMASIDKKKKIK